MDYILFELISHCRFNSKMLLTFLKTQQGLAYIREGTSYLKHCHSNANAYHFIHMHYNRPRLLSIVLPRPLSTWFAVLGDLCKEGNHRGEIRTSRLLLDPSFCLPIRSLKLVHKALKKNRIISIRKQLRDRKLNSYHKDMVKIKCFLQIRRRRQHFHTTSSTNQAFG